MRVRVNGPVNFGFGAYFFGYDCWREGRAKISSDRRASMRDAADSIGDACSTRPGECHHNNNNNNVTSLHDIMARENKATLATIKTPYELNEI